MTWIDLICDFGGSCWPSKLSTRMIASGPAMSLNWRAISAGIVRQRLNLLLRHVQAERVGSARSAAWPSRADRHRLGHVLQRQHDDVLVVAAVDADVAQQAHLEPGELGAEL